MTQIDYEAPDPTPDDMVKMRHPNVEGTATATRQAVEEVWAPRGWEIVPDETEDIAPFLDEPFVAQEDREDEAPDDV